MFQISGPNCQLFNNLYILVLMNVHLNVDNELLASLFDVHASTIYFQKWIDVLFERLKLLVKWPKHEQLYKTMPKEFKKNLYSHN